MISYNENDYNLTKIASINGNFNFLETDQNYYVYGLIQKENPPVLIERNTEEKPSSRKLEQMKRWLAKNGIQMALDYSEKRSVRIGLRRDIRANPKFAAALIRTFVAFFEGALKIKPNFEIPKVKLKRSDWKDEQDPNSDYWWNSPNYTPESE